MNNMTKTTLERKVCLWSLRQEPQGNANFQAHIHVPYVTQTHLSRASITQHWAGLINKYLKCPTNISTCQSNRDNSSTEVLLIRCVRLATYDNFTLSCYQHHNIIRQDKLHKQNKISQIKQPNSCKRCPQWPKRVACRSFTDCNVSSLCSWSWNDRSLRGTRGTTLSGKINVVLWNQISSWNSVIRTQEWSPRRVTCSVPATFPSTSLSN